MTIGLDASRSISIIQKTGVEKVSDELLTQFIKFKSQNSKVKSNDFDFIFYTPKQIDWLPKENQKILSWPLKFLWTQIRLAFELIFHPPQVMFFPVHVMPLLLIASYKLRVTSYYKVIHDIAFKKHSELYSLKQRLILNLDLWLSLKLCTKIFVPTETVKNDILFFCQSHRPRRKSGGQSGNLVNNLTNKIIVTPWGYTPHRHSQPLIDGEESQKNYQDPWLTLRMTNNKLKQFLYIGRIEEKKNIKNLIKAFEIFHEKNHDYKLILAGKMGDWIPDRVGDDSSGVEFLGFISEEKKQELLRESTALVLVSKEEGFGFPILEAFDFGLPVIASNISVLREIGDEACFYVNPNSPEDIAKCFEKIIATNLSAQIQKGYERLQNFSWEKTAEKILNEITPNLNKNTG